MTKGRETSDFHMLAIVCMHLTAPNAFEHFFLCIFGPPLMREDGFFSAGCTCTCSMAHWSKTINWFSGQTASTMLHIQTLTMNRTLIKAGIGKHRKGSFSCREWFVYFLWSLTVKICAGNCAFFQAFKVQVIDFHPYFSPPHPPLLVCSPEGTPKFTLLEHKARKLSSSFCATLYCCILDMLLKVFRVQCYFLSEITWFTLSLMQVSVPNPFSLLRMKETVYFFNKAK